MRKVEVIPLFRVNIESGCLAFPTLPSNYHLTWPNVAPHHCVPEKSISECFIECFGWVEIVWSVPSALIMLTWKCDSDPTSQGCLTPGELDLVVLIRDLHHSTKDLTSPVSKVGRDYWWELEFHMAQTEAFISFSHKPLESQHVEAGGQMARMLMNKIPAALL